MNYANESEGQNTYPAGNILDSHMFLKLLHVKLIVKKLKIGPQCEKQHLHIMCMVSYECKIFILAT